MKELVDLSFGTVRYAALRRRRALYGGSGIPDLVFDIVELERETQAAVFWR